MTAYALLTYTLLGGVATALPVVKWLSQQWNAWELHLAFYSGAPDRAKGGSGLGGLGSGLRALWKLPECV